MCHQEPTKFVHSRSSPPKGEWLGHWASMDFLSLEFDVEKVSPMSGLMILDGPELMILTLLKSSILRFGTHNQLESDEEIPLEKCQSDGPLRMLGWSEKCVSPRF